MKRFLAIALLCLFAGSVQASTTVVNPEEGQQGLISVGDWGVIQNRGFFETDIFLGFGRHRQVHIATVDRPLNKKVVRTVAGALVGLLFLVAFAFRKTGPS